MPAFAPLHTASNSPDKDTGTDMCVQVIEKNTFISVVVEEDEADTMHSVLPRRNSSVPPSLRLSCSDGRGCELGPSSSEDKSTVCDFSDSQSSAESDSDILEGSTRGLQSSAAIKRSSTGLLESFPKASSPTDVSPTKSRLSSSAKAFKPRGLQQMTPQVAAGHAQASLVTAVWMSQGQTSFFVQRCGNVIDNLRMTLISTRHVNGVEVRMGEQCWSVAVQLPKGVVPDETLNAAKKSLLEGAENSENIYVLGYNSAPFVSTPFGFSAFLCDVKDNAAACWDMYSTGYCRRCKRCPWEHPEQQARVSVIIKRVDY